MPTLMKCISLPSIQLHGSVAATAAARQRAIIQICHCILQRTEACFYYWLANSECGLPRFTSSAASWYLPFLRQFPLVEFIMVCVNVIMQGKSYSSQFDRQQGINFSDAGFRGWRFSTPSVYVWCPGAMSLKVLLPSSALTCFSAMLLAKSPTCLPNHALVVLPTLLPTFIVLIFCVYIHASCHMYECCQRLESVTPTWARIAFT